MIAISVVIPVRNRSSQIKRCLASVLNQTYQALEVIVVDDNSTDNTREAVKKIDSVKIKLIELGDHKGAQAARNRGIVEASGDWIAFQDSDDEWLPNKLERQVEELSRARFDPYCVVHSDAVRHNIRTGRSSVWHLPLVNGAKEDVFRLLLSEPGPLFPALIVSKEALNAIGYLDPEVPSYQEWDTAIRLARHCRYVHVREPLFVYHVGDGISSDGNRDIDGYHYVITKYRLAIETLCGEEAWKKHVRVVLGKCLRADLLGRFRQYRAAYSVTDDEIDKVRIQEVCYALDEGQWKKVRSLRGVPGSRSAKVRAIEACRYFHLRPKYLSGLINLIRM
jgi:glycosyltransferase involved in cell wall biosynthesis